MQKVIRVCFLYFLFGATCSSRQDILGTFYLYSLLTQTIVYSVPTGNADYDETIIVIAKMLNSLNNGHFG